MQAIILAAGMGKRLNELTENNAKCMVAVNGISLIERSLVILDQKHLSRIVIVVGYKSEKLTDFIDSLNIQTPIVYINNRIYHKTNNIYSLLQTKRFMIEDDTLLLESDIIFEEEIIDLILNDPRETLALVDKFAGWMDGTCMKLDETDSIVDFIPGKYLNFSEKEKYFKTVNIYKFSRDFSTNVYLPFLEAYLMAMGVNEYYESVIKLIALLERPQIKAKRLSGQMWYEIDDIQDLDIAESLFTKTHEEKYNLLIKRFGGYWRYPALLDFCYLVNPYYPSKQMIDELIANFEKLVCSYPSGMRINSLLASKYFDVNQERILVGNGAAELIKALMEKLSGKTGIISPSFDEYRHRIIGEILEFQSIKNDFSYSVEDIINYFENNPVSQIILINPDNPSGNHVSYEEIKRLINWCKSGRIRIIIDESFLDFSDENAMLDKTALNREIMDMYKYLYIIKSISKSFGIAGLRLGILASPDTDIIQDLKKNVAIWNINSFGEYYMQIAGKYKNDYLLSLKRLRASRKALLDNLNKISYLHAFESQANFIMCEITDNSVAVNELTAYLLEKNILIKDLTKKINNGKQYIRIAVRNEEDNQKLIWELSKYKK